MSDSMTPQGKPRKSHKKPSAGEQAQEQKTASEGVSSASESSTDNDSGMSDLERLLAEEGINLGTVEEDRPAGSEGMSAKNWMISTSTETLVRKKLDTELTEETPPPVSPVTTPADNVLETEPPHRRLNQPPPRPLLKQKMTGAMTMKATPFLLWIFYAPSEKNRKNAALLKKNKLRIRAVDKFSRIPRILKT
jgi:hypothetical protein